MGGPNSPLEKLSEDAHHLLRLAPIKKWALETLESRGVPVAALLARFPAELVNEGAALREHVQWQDGVERDSVVWLAARVYELCRCLEISEGPAGPDRDRCVGRVPQWAFELGRLSILAKVYGIDEAGERKRVAGAKAANRKFSESDRRRWREIAERDFSGRTMRDAARSIARREGRPESQVESIRQALMKKESG